MYPIEKAISIQRAILPGTERQETSPPGRGWVGERVFVHKREGKEVFGMAAEAGKPNFDINQDAGKPDGLQDARLGGIQVGWGVR